jgi:hypothetical protein
MKIPTYQEQLPFNKINTIGVKCKIKNEDL